MRRAVFLDRDGVINANVERDGRPVAPTRIEDFRILPGVEDAVRRLRGRGYELVVVTNQPDVETGRTPRAVVEAMHGLVRSRLGIDDIRACFHTDAAGCACRKPKPGMLLAAAAEKEFDLTRSWMVGDRWRDIEAGRAAGCLTILIDCGYEQERQSSPGEVVTSLAEAADRILASDQGGVALSSVPNGE